MTTWTLQDAKARFSELVAKALTGEPQRVTRRGEDAVVIVRAIDYDELTEPEESLADFFARSPHREIELDVSRSTDTSRDIVF